MSGHSKWSTIKRAKGVADARRGNLFTKLSNAISIAVREGGGGDPNFNFKLRLAVDRAKEANMPKDNIQRAIDKGLGKGGTSQLHSAVYEGFAPGRVAVMVETVTDSATRTASELRNVFEKNGGSLASPGAVSYMFKRVGEVGLAKDGMSFDEVFEKALEAEADDVEDNGDHYSVFTTVENLNRVKEELEALGLKVIQAALIFKPNKDTLMELEAEKIDQVMKFVQKIEEMDDVQNVYVNL